MAEAAPGDLVLIADGTYTSGTWTFSASGTSSDTIAVIAENPGSWGGRTVTFRGGTRIRVTGSNLIIGGFEVAGLGNRAIQIVGSEAVRWTDTEHVGCGDLFGDRYLLVHVGSSDLRFDHNLWQNCPGTPFSTDQTRDGMSPTDILFEYNTLRDIDGEIGVKLGHRSSRWDTRMIVRRNEFARNQGPYAIESKVGGAVLVGNYIHDSAGSITLREGPGSVVAGNLIERCARGVRVFDGGHIIVNNVIVDSGGGGSVPSLFIGSGIDRERGLLCPGATDHRSDHALVTSALVAHNTILDYHGVAIEVGRDQPSNTLGCRLRNPPRDVWIYNNVIASAETDADTALLVHRAEALEISNNYFGVADLGDTSAAGWSDTNRYEGEASFVDFRAGGGAWLDRGRDVDRNGWSNRSSQDYDQNARVAGPAADLGAVETCD